MATIYRFIVENRYSGMGEGRNANANVSKKGAGKKGANSFNVFGTNRGGVEHGRRMRAINPLINKATGGYWEKSVRLGRAGVGMAKNVEKYGAKGVFAGPALAIIIALIIQTMIKLQNKNLEWGKERNTQNYKQMETGVTAIHGEYDLNVNIISGRRTYNENK